MPLKYSLTLNQNSLRGLSQPSPIGTSLIPDLSIFSTVVRLELARAEMHEVGSDNTTHMLYEVLAEASQHRRQCSPTNKTPAESTLSSNFPLMTMQRPLTLWCRLRSRLTQMAHLSSNGIISLTQFLSASGRAFAHVIFPRYIKHKLVPYPQLSDGSRISSLEFSFIASFNPTSTSKAFSRHRADGSIR